METPASHEIGTDYASLDQDVETWKERHALLRASLAELHASLREFDRELGRHARHLERRTTARSPRRHAADARRRHGGLSGRHRQIRYHLMRLAALMEHGRAPVH